LKILLLTGRLAEPIVRRAARKCPSKYEIEVSVMPLSVASLATSQSIISHLRSVRLEDYDLIMVSGAIQESMRPVKDALGINVVKGPKHASDLPAILSLYDPRKLSPDIPADILLAKEMIRYAEEAIREIELAVDSKPHIKVNGLPIPVDPPPIRIVSEIPDVHLLSEEDLMMAAERRIKEGADILALGFQAGVANREKVRRSVKLLEDLNVPIAVDSIIPSEIIAGVEAGASMIMSLEAGNIMKVADKVKHTPSVIIPYDSRMDYAARTVEDKLRLLERNIESAQRHGVKNLIADPVLEPIDPSGSAGTFQSLMAYHGLKHKMPDVPLLMGLCNVSELIDVDSHGVNATLTMLAAEIGVSLLLVVERSIKTIRSTAEAKIAAQMVAIAYKKEAPPKDLGLNLLILKDKRKVETRLDLSDSTIIEASRSDGGYVQDPMGFYTIKVNHEEGVIEALYKGCKGKILIKGETARSIYGEILKRGLISELSHAFYLGVELGRAEEALRIGKNYVQEEKLLELPKPINMK